MPTTSASTPWTARSRRVVHARQVLDLRPQRGARPAAGRASAARAVAAHALRGVAPSPHVAAARSRATHAASTIPSAPASRHRADHVAAGRANERRGARRLRADHRLLHLGGPARHARDRSRRSRTARPAARRTSRRARARGRCRPHRAPPGSAGQHVRVDQTGAGARPASTSSTEAVAWRVISRDGSLAHAGDVRAQHQVRERQQAGRRRRLVREHVERAPRRCAPLERADERRPRRRPRRARC